MNPKLLPWVKTWWAWIPPVLLLASCISGLVWQTSGSLGQRGAIATQTEALTKRLETLQAMNTGAAQERDEVAHITLHLDRIFDDVFGRYDARLTQVLRAIDQAVRETGMIPDGYRYAVSAINGADGSGFSIKFHVEGTYAQVVQMLDTIQSSPQFLVVDQVSFQGEEDALTRILMINLTVSTVFSDAEPGRLQELVSRLQVSPPAEESE